MKNADIITAFVARADKIGKTRKVWTSAGGADLVNYGTIIARWIPTGSTIAASALLVSADRWSDTTTTLQNLAVAKARNADLTVFRVPKLSGVDMHTVNLASFELQAVDALHKLVKGRVASAAAYRRQALAMIAEGQRYAKIFGVSWKHSVPDPDTILHASELEL